jgi:1-hydroxycarotenoid 3,4-desaturase
VSGAENTIVIGAGVGGLVAALDLARRGIAVTVLERAAAPGGKMREVTAGGAAIDAGPTVFTMRWVFEEIFSDAGASLADHLTLVPASVLARHAWDARGHLDLFADVDRTADAIGAFAGPAEAAGFRDFCARSRKIYQTLEGPFIRAARPTALSLVRGAGLRGIGDLWRISPFDTLWKALGSHFADPRLKQLFGRYSTYCGSSPYLAPATLMLVAHVERDGVWLVEGGMHKIAVALETLAAARGVKFRYGAHVDEIIVERGGVVGVRLADGERIATNSVVLNGDAAAVAGGLLGRAISGAVPPVPPAERSLSAVTWAMLARTEGFPLVRHTVFFSDDYASEFSDIFRHGQLPGRPTVYVCAQDRDDTGAPEPAGPERLLCLVNAPALGDSRAFPASEIDACTERTFSRLTRCGLTVHRAPEATTITTPGEFARLFPATGGALYGQAVHGSQASFRRPGARTKIPGRRRMGRWPRSGGRRRKRRSHGSIWRGGRRIRARACRWRRYRAGLRRRAWPRIALLRPAGREEWLCVVVCRRAKRRRRACHHADRVYRQRVFAVLRLGAARRAGGPREFLRAQRRAVWRGRKTLDADRTWSRRTAT